MFKTLATIAVFGLATAGISAQARSIEVNFADLNLSSPAGQERLAKRVDSAARDVCGMDERRIGTRIRSDEAVACYKAAKAKAHAQFAAAAQQQAKGG